MRYQYEYETESDRAELISQHEDKTLIEELNIVDGNFLVFSDDPENDKKQVTYITIPEEEFKELKQNNTLLKAQNNALTERTDFHEEILTEIILTIAQ